MSHDTDDVLDFINSLPESKAPLSSARGSSDNLDSSDDFLEFLDELSAHEKSKGVKSKLEPKKTDTKGLGSEKGSQKGSQKGSEKDSVKDIGNSVGSGSAKAETHSKQTSSLAGSSGSSGSASMAGSGSEGSGSGVSGSGGSGSGGSVGESVGQYVAGERHSSDHAPSDSITSEQANPLDSITSWWSTEGSSKVTSLWGSLTSNAHQLSESTYQLASSTSNSLSHQRQKFLKENPGMPDSDQILHITDKLNSMLSTMSQQIKDGLADKEDEVLNIFLVYDLNINYLDSLCASKFNKVMGQVEGGIRTSVSNFNHKHEQTSGKHYDLGMFHGKALDGEKLCFANLESSIKYYLKITQVENKQLVSDELSEEINTSNVFIAIQPITTGTEKSDLEKSEKSASEGGPVLIEASNPNSFSFTFILKDISNNITIISKSQPFPARWARWIAGHSEDVDAVFNAGEEGDAVDPSEWVQDWIHDGLGLTFGVLAQEYVTKRMGIE